MTNTLDSILKIRIKHDQGSKLLGNCNPLAEDNEMHGAAQALVDLTDVTGYSISKIVETELVGL